MIQSLLRLHSGTIFPPQIVSAFQVFCLIYALLFKYFFPSSVFHIIIYIYPKWTALCLKCRTVSLPSPSGISALLFTFSLESNPAAQHQLIYSSKDQTTIEILKRCEGKEKLFHNQLTAKGYLFEIVLMTRHKFNLNPVYFSGQKPNVSFGGKIHFIFFLDIHTTENIFMKLVPHPI